MKELSKKTTPESIFENMIKSQRVMAEGYKTGNIRTAVREFMRSEEKAGRLKLNKTDSFRIREYSPMTEDDPIDVFRRHYGEDALEAVDEIGDVFMQGESFSHYEELLRNSVDKKFLTVKKTGAGEYDASVVAAEKIRKAKEQEAKNLKILEEFDPKDRTKNADGGLIDILKL
jgi:vacuolar-type H+-ATPase subunit C/Vma6